MKMLDQRLTLKQKQELALKPKMLQSLKMLALPILELEAYIKQELVNNPLLELRDDKDEEEESLDESSFEGSQPESKQALDDIEDLPEHNSTLSEAKELTEILDQWNDYHQSYEWSQGGQDAEQGESLIRYEENLLDKYLEQLYPLSLAENEMEFAADLVDSCDNYGFL
ncbi:MAG: RNA polymerase sigma-54 factor, partial [Candidatus Cloacimonetes bacterium]|nr:RNA polymerase sigma-54 factor [Candidatus Cloacimonadota bacterium]